MLKVNGSKNRTIINYLFKIMMLRMMSCSLFDATVRNSGKNSQLGCTNLLPVLAS